MSPFYSILIPLQYSSCAISPNASICISDLIQMQLPANVVKISAERLTRLNFKISLRANLVSGLVSPLLSKSLGTLFRNFVELYVCLSTWKNQDQRSWKVFKSILVIFDHLIFEKCRTSLSLMSTCPIVHLWEFITVHRIGECFRVELTIPNPDYTENADYCTCKMLKNAYASLGQLQCWMNFKYGRDELFFRKIFSIFIESFSEPEPQSQRQAIFHILL